MALLLHTIGFEAVLRVFASIENELDGLLRHQRNVRPNQSIGSITIFKKKSESKGSFPFLREGGFKPRKELKDGRVIITYQSKTQNRRDWTEMAKT